MKDKFQSPEVQALLERITKVLEKEGIYVQQAGFVAADESEDSPVFLQLVGVVGERAFEMEQVNPEQAAIDAEFEKIMGLSQPDPIDEIKRNMKEGGGILDLDDLDLD